MSWHANQPGSRVSDARPGPGWRRTPSSATGAHLHTAGQCVYHRFWHARSALRGTGHRGAQAALPAWRGDLVRAVLRAERHLPSRLITTAVRGDEGRGPAALCARGKTSEVLAARRASEHRVSTPNEFSR